MPAPRPVTTDAEDTLSINKCQRNESGLSY